MIYEELLNLVKNAGKDPSSLVFEDELTGLPNRRFVQNYMQYKISWDALESHRVSLLMMDIDNFKMINDSYGHDSGDRALVHVAGILKGVCGKEGLPIRYGGDEFMVLLSGKDKETALATGRKLLEQVRESPVRLKEGQPEVFLTLSIGVAEAPADAKKRAVLIQQADTALYNAKQSGRNRVCDAANAVCEDVFPKIAIHQLANLRMAGREAQLAQVMEALREFSQKKSRVLIAEGADGMGKSAFLREIQRSLEDSKAAQVKLFGTPQEKFRPYYLVADLVIELFNRREDKGKSVFDLLGPEDQECLSLVLPCLGANTQAPDQKQQREAIFRSLVRLVNDLVESAPLMIFADDLQFADEASLLLLRSIILQNRFPLFICGTTADISRSTTDINPLLDFWLDHGKELDIQRIILTPLSQKDIADHLEKMFPFITRPVNFEREIYDITKGNPLFVSEIFNRLIHDRMIVFTDQHWMVRHPDPVYLSASLDQVVTEIIGSFDDETRRILNYASIFGESVPLSMLTGFSGDRETRVLDFLDSARAYGLVISDFHADDENIRFLSKRIQKIVYGGVEEGLKQDLHEKIALYQEKLYEQKVLPSAAVLAWHFERSANIDKSRIYNQQHQEYSTTVFSAHEAVQYPVERDASMPDIPLDPVALKDLWLFFRSFLIAVSGIRLYPAGNMARVNALHQVRNILERIFARYDRIRVAVEKNCLVVNGETIDTADSKPAAESICSLFAGIDLGSIAVRKDFSKRDLENMLEAIGQADPRDLHERYWEEVCRNRGLESIELKQLRYAKVEEEEQSQDKSTEHARDEGCELPIDLPGEVPLGEDVALVARVVTTLTGALSKIRLYPPDSSVMTDAVDQVMAALAALLEKSPVLNMTVVDTSLLINGVKIDTRGFKAAASNFLSFMQSTALDSITFIEGISSGEILAFLEMEAKQPADELNADFWRSVERKKEFRGILFNRSLYTIFAERAESSSQQFSAADGKDSASDIIPDVLPSLAAGDDSGLQSGFKMGDLVGILRDLSLSDLEKEFSLVLKRSFDEYSRSAVPVRESVAEACERVTNFEDFVLPPRYLKLIAEHLRPAFRQEMEPILLGRLYRLLQRIAFLFIDFGEFGLAGWVFFSMRERVRELKDATNTLSVTLQSFAEPLPARAVDGLREALKSAELPRRRQAVQFLSTMDERILPYLAELVKQEDDLQARQFAAGLIKNLGGEAVELFRRDLVLEISADDQIRMLEVADLVTDDIHLELAHVLDSENGAVRRAAFRLAERLNDEPTVDLLCDIVNGEFSGKTVPAIRALGRMKSARSVQVLIEILDRAKEQEIQSACCQALGQAADPAAVDVLSRILTTRGILSMQKKYSDNIRALAAYALVQISHPRVIEIMKSLSEDANPLVRQTARSAVARDTGAN